MRPSPCAIDALLPQTQCTRCGFAACRPYAEAIAAGEAAINQCPPGGAGTIAALARLCQTEPLPLNPANGHEGPARVALIDESACIGCAKCLPPCPVDAIVGAARQMHTVLAAVCTGCELCVAPCPVDCIRMVERPGGTGPSADDNRDRFQARTSRLARRAAERDALLTERKRAAAPGTASREWPRDQIG
ncbi:MAG: RnfABCDGE type electron transport complex subunit B [Gammaproteobacteria bacterium]|nr:RnfABCDGE type electron transport complex subunit B [Gammaproteobacteria bacterium]MBV9619710.1 RnfABCDGE type electron transport complex subunit B [Gammaproteobacteria bacterium]